MKKNSQYLEKEFIKNKYPKTYKTFSILPWLIVLIILSMVLFWYCLFITTKSLSYPNLIFFIAFFILAYYVWWIIRWFEHLLLSFAAAFKFYSTNKIDFNKILQKNSQKLSKKERMLKKELKNDLNAEDIIHRMIIPTYKEEEEILDQTINSISKANYPLEKIAITIAWEEWDKENFEKISNKLIKKYQNFFKHINKTIHPKNQIWEVSWKGANIKYAAKKEYPKILKKFSTSPEKVIVTSLDADTNISQKYLSILTYTYISADNRKHLSYQPMIFFFNNFWEAPFFSKLISLWNSFWILFNSFKKMWMRNFSTHAQSLDALIELDFRSSQTIVEDWHQYRRSFFGFEWNYECIPLYTKVYQDTNLNKNIRKTIKAQYNQMKRWAHWVEDIPYVVCQWIYNFKNINFFRTLYEFVRLFEGTILWSTLHIMLTLGLIFTMLKDIKLSNFITLGNSISIFTNFSLLILITVIVFQFIFLPRNRIKDNKKRIKESIKFIVFYSWLVGPILFFFSWLPALHAQIFVMLWKPMKKFNVTQKIRKNNKV